MLRKLSLVLAAVATLTIAAPATAQPRIVEPFEDPDPADAEDGSAPAGTPAGAAESPAPRGRFVEKAGLGSPVGYAKAGVLELGGSAGFVVASGMRDLTVSPMAGWFVADDLQLSAIVNLTHVSNGTDSTTFVSAVVEPSYHMPFNPNVLGFLGVGVGAAYVRDLGGGIAIAPRLGAKLLVGRSGVLTPSLSWQYTTHDVPVNGAMATAVAAVSSSLRMNVGYTVMW